jgi:serine/threonine protein kinase
VLTQGPNSRPDAERAALSTLDSQVGEVSPTAIDGAGVGGRDGAGQQVGRYQPLRVLGQGSAGVVHSAYDALLDRVVALKTVRTDRCASTDVGRFIREAKALARMSHPNIVPIHDVSIIGGQVFLAMELIRGSTLRQHLAGAPGVSHDRIVELFIEAGRGLDAVHRAGLVHRDFKPESIRFSLRTPSSRETPRISSLEGVGGKIGCPGLPLLAPG